VTGAGGDFAVGGYKVAVDFLSLGGVLAPITNTVAGVLDGHTNDTLATALNLAPPQPTDQRFDATYRGVIEDAADTDTYRVSTAAFAAGTPVTLDAMVWGTDSTPLNPRVRVFDAAGNPVAFQVLANDAGLFSLQIPNAAAGQAYFIQVAARTPGGANGTGGYFLAADFNRSALIAFAGADAGTTSAAAAATTTMTVGQSGLFEFALAADAGASVTMTVYDAAGNAVFALTAAGGQPTATTFRYLAAGAYTVKYTTTAAGPAGYDLYLLDLSDPVGPYKSSTSKMTTTSPPPPPPPADTAPASADPSSDTTTGTGDTTVATSSGKQTMSYGYTY
jgi:hypothetical protein